MPFSRSLVWRRRILVLACAGLALLMAGCGGATPPPTGTEAASTLAPVVITAPASTPSPTTVPSPTPAIASRCGVSTDPVATDAATIRVTQDSMGFFDYDGPVTIKAGQSVTFVNGNGAPHTITEGVYGEAVADACVDTRLGTNTSMTITFDEPGTYQFTCRPHRSMQTTVVVK
jgi:plastocyanin